MIIQSLDTKGNSIAIDLLATSIGEFTVLINAPFCNELTCSSIFLSSSSDAKILTTLSV